jgi:hypothetical protein
MIVKLIILPHSKIEYAVPMCDKAKKACNLVGQNFLHVHQIKLIQLMGCEVHIVCDQEQQQ